jgi:hypothetical protein
MSFFWWDHHTKKPIGGIEPPTFRLQSECSTTKLNRHHTHPVLRGSIVVSIPACHAGDPGSIPGLGVFLLGGGTHKHSKKELTTEGIEPPIFGSGIRRVAIAPCSRSQM